MQPHSILSCCCLAVLLVLLQAWQINSFQPKSFTNNLPWKSLSTRSSPSEFSLGFATSTTKSVAVSKHMLSGRLDTMHSNQAKTSLFHSHTSKSTRLYSNKYSLTLDHKFLPSYAFHTKILLTTYLIIGYVTAIRIVLHKTKLGAALKKFIPQAFYNVFNGIGYMTRRYLQAFDVRLSPKFQEVWKQLKDDFMGINEDDDDEEASGELVQVARTPVVATQQAWMRCKLEDYEVINDKYTKVSFKATSEVVKPLNSLIGRKLTLCVRDEDGNLIKQNFYPLTLHYKTQFDIILATEYVNNKFQYSIEEMNEQRAFNEALEYLEDDDELAFKLGPSTFLYQGKDNIKKLMLIASGRGIVPIITLLRRVLSSQQEFQIENCMLIWINEDKDDDFILDEEIEELEDEFPDQLIVRRVHDSKLTEQGRVLDRRMLDGLPMYESGRVAIVSVDEVTPIEAKFQDAFDELGYPQENVMFV